MKNKDTIPSGWLTLQIWRLWRWLHFPTVMKNNTLLTKSVCQHYSNYASCDQAAGPVCPCSLEDSLHPHLQIPVSHFLCWRRQKTVENYIQSFFPFFLKSGKLLLLLSSRKLKHRGREAELLVIGQITLLYQTINHCAGPATTPGNPNLPV